MKQTLKLTFIYFKEQLLGLMGSFNKKAQRKTLPAIILLLLLLAAAIGYSIYNIGNTLSTLNMQSNVLIIGLLMSLFLSFMITINDTQGTMYKSKDYDMLMSLPIKNVSIIFAKYVSTYCVSLLFFAIVALPTFVVYFIFNEVTAFGIIFGLLSLIFMPAFGQFISCCMGWLVNIISSKMKNKNIVRVILSLVLAVGLSIFISFANSEIFGSVFSNGIPLWFKIFFSNIYFLFVSITTKSFLYFFLAFIVSLGFVLLGIGIILIGFKKINSSLNTTRIKGKVKPITYSESSVFSKLFKKEASTFFNSPVYCVNGLIGLIMCVVVTIIVLTTMSRLQQSLGNEAELSSIMTAVMAFSVAMCMGVAPTTSVSINIEGTKLQTLKSLPVKFKDVALAKCSLNLIMYIPVLILCTIIYCIVSKVGWLLSILILLYLLLTTFAQTILGLLINLKFPRLNWSSETQAVKSGASLLLTMFLDMFLALLPMVIFIILYSELSWLTITIYMTICLGLQLIYALTVLIIFIKKAEKLFNAIPI